MLTRTLGVGLAVLLAGGLLAAGLANAALLVSEVKDDGGFFKPETIEKANKAIKNIKNQYKKDLVIETYKAVPSARKEAFEKLPKNQFFEEWARDRAKALEVNGIYILVCKEPSHLQVEVGNETIKKAFTASDRTRLVELLIGRFKKKEFDEGLQEAVELVNKTLSSNR